MTYQLQGEVNLGQISVSKNLAPDWVLAIPDTMKIVRHEVDPIDVGLHGLQVEVAEIPVGRRSSKGHNVVAATGVNGLSQLFEESCIILPVAICTATIFGAGILPVCRTVSEVLKALHGTPLEEKRLMWVEGNPGGRLEY